MDVVIVFLINIVSRYPAAGKCFQKTRYPAVRNFDQKQCLKSLECSKQLPGVFTQSKLGISCKLDVNFRLPGI